MEMRISEGSRGHSRVPESSAAPDSSEERQWALEARHLLGGGPGRAPKCLCEGGPASLQGLSAIGRWAVL
eukprot:15446216-Alexandrium_andersonii.AAC.1